MRPHQLRKYGLPDLQLGTVLIKPAVSVRNLGAHFDQMITMVNFINHKIKVASYHLRRIGSIRKYITAGICHKLVVALVTSNIDYCNGLLGGLAAKHVDRLQRLQNRAARLVTRSKAAMHITPIRKDLHWLPIQERINYKIIVTVYKCIHRLAPNYLSSILTTRTRDNRLRQKQVCHELNTHSCAKVVGKQAFGTRAPELWNKLPLNIRTIPTLQSFKQTLKTHLLILKLLAHMTFYSVSAVIGYAAGYKRLQKYNNNNNNNNVQCGEFDLIFCETGSKKSTRMIVWCLTPP